MNQQEPSTETSGLGERRRRREAERAARLAAERAGQAQPLTRRELRIRQLEEQARLEAIATGELPLVDDEGRPLSAETMARSVAATNAPPAPSARDRVADAAPAAPLSRRSLRDRVRADAAVPEDGPTERTATARRPVVRAPHTAKGVRSLDATGTLTGVQPVRAAATPSPPRGPVADEPPVTTDPAGWESAVALPAVTDDSTLVVDAALSPARGTATPASAPSAPSADDRSAPETHTGAQPAPGPAFAPVRREPTDAERARSAPSPGRSPSAASGPEAVAAAALDHGEDDDYVDEARPQWASLAEFSAASSQSPDEPTEPVAQPAGRPGPARRSVRDRTVDAAASRSADESGYADETDTRSSAASLVKIVALVLVAIVIGLLIGLLAFNQDPDGASMRIQALAQDTSALLRPTT